MLEILEEKRSIIFIKRYLAICLILIVFFILPVILTNAFITPFLQKTNGVLKNTIVYDTGKVISSGVKASLFNSYWWVLVLFILIILIWLLLLFIYLKIKNSSD